MRDRLLKALRREPVDAVPIWLMRQAGRHLPGYRRLRERHGILEIARTPELAAEVTREPLDRFDLDAAVVFADISLPFAPLGIEFSIQPGIGPVIAEPLRTRADLARMREADLAKELGFVGEAIRRFLTFGTGRPIIGFAGAPFTLAAYLVEGGPSRDFTEVKRWIYADPDGFHLLLDRLARATADYLRMQRSAGATALQLFDTWAGVLPSSVYEEHVLPSLQGLLADLRSAGAPTIYFSTGSSHLFPWIARVGPDAIGVDFRPGLAETRRRVGPGFALQGNLDPAVLLTEPKAVERAARGVLDELPDGLGHVFNLGHGVPPGAKAENVTALVEFVHAYSEARRSAG